VASLVELTVERTMSDSYSDALRWRIEEKVDAIWFHLAAQYSSSPENKDGPLIWSNFRSSNDLFLYPRNFDSVQHQLITTQNIRITAQIFGGVLVLFGALIEKMPYRHSSDTMSGPDKSRKERNPS
jgi:hypothetical protein